MTQRLNTSIICFIFLFLFILTPSTYSRYTQIDQFNDLENTSYISLNLREDASKIQKILNAINESLLQSYLVPLVALGPRFTGTYGCEQSAAFIKEQFQEMGLETRYHNWIGYGNIYHPKLYISQNVEGILPGTSSEGIILFGAHYDTVEEAPGANDDGSGVAAVLAAAHVLSQYSFHHTLYFVAFSGEEVGLLGSWAYAKDLNQKKTPVLFDFNADMIGRATTIEGGRNMGITVTEDATFIPDLFRTINDIAETNLEFNTGVIKRDGHGWSDYYPFCYYGYEAVACWQGEHDPNMHTPEDTLDNVNFTYLVKTTKMITGAMAVLADSFSLQTQIQITAPDHQSLYYKGMKTMEHNLKKIPSIIIDAIWIWAEPVIEDSSLQQVEFYLDDHLQYIDTSAPFKWYYNERSFGSHQITVKSVDGDGRTSEDFLDVFFINPRTHN